MTQTEILNRIREQLTKRNLFVEVDCRRWRNKVRVGGFCPLKLALGCETTNMNAQKLVERAAIFGIESDLALKFIRSADGITNSPFYSQDLRDNLENIGLIDWAPLKEKTNDTENEIQTAN